MDDDDLQFRQARALLLAAHAIAVKTDESIDSTFAKLVEFNTSISQHAVRNELSKFMLDLSYLFKASTSSRWTPGDGGFQDVLDSSHSILCTSVPGPIKDEIRGKVNCTLCGQAERHCHYTVHFAGTPLVDRGSALDELSYSANEFLTPDLYKLSKLLEKYNRTIAETVVDGGDSGQFPEPSYLGLAVPGETCLKRIVGAFAAQDLVRDVLVQVDAKHPKLEDPITRTSIIEVAARITQIQDVARDRGQKPKMTSFENDRFWFELLQRFSDREGIKRGDELGFLRAGYARMTHNIEGSGWTPSEYEDSPIRTSRAKRTSIVETEDEEDDDDDEEEDDDDWLVHDDTEDEEVEEGFPSRARQWGQTQASRDGPFSKRRRTITAQREPFASHAARSSNRRTSRGASSSGTTLSDDPVIAVYEQKQISHHTAAALRTHPNNSIRARISSIKDLIPVAVALLNHGNLVAASGLLYAVATLTDILNKHHQGSSPDEIQRAKLLEEVELKLEFVIRGLEGDEKRACIVGLVVAHELLGK